MNGCVGCAIVEGTRGVGSKGDGGAGAALSLEPRKKYR